MKMLGLWKIWLKMLLMETLSVSIEDNPTTA